MDNSRVEEIITALHEIERTYQALEVDDSKIVPLNILSKLVESKIFSIAIKKEYGGLDFSLNNIVKILNKLGRIDATLALMTVIFSLCGAKVIQKYASQTVKQKFLPKLTSGEIFLSIAITEEGVGTNITNITTSITNKDNKYYINGKKCWISLASESTIFIVLAKSASSDYIATVIPYNKSDISLNKNLVVKMGLKALPQTREVSFNNAVITSEYLLNDGNDGLEVVKYSFDYCRLFIASFTVGCAEKIIDIMESYANKRMIVTGLQIDNPICKKYIQHSKYAFLILEKSISRFAQIIDNRCFISEEIFMALKILSTEWVFDIADRAVQLLGVRGYDEQYLVAKYLRDIRGLRIAEGPTDALLVHIGSVAMNTNAKFYHFFEEMKANSLKEEIKIYISENIDIDFLMNNQNSYIEESFYLGKLVTYQIVKALFTRIKLHDQLSFQSLEWLHYKINNIRVFEVDSI